MLSHTQHAVSAHTSITARNDRPAIARLPSSEFREDADVASRFKLLDRSAQLQARGAPNSGNNAQGLMLWTCLSQAHVFLRVFLNSSPCSKALSFAVVFTMFSTATVPAAATL